MSDMRALTWWQFAAACDGWAEANTSNDETGMSDQEADSAWELVRAH